MIYKLKTDWLFEIKQFTSNLDLTISENLPLKKVTDFIEKNKDLSLTQRFSQITINHILFDLEHPFLYLNSRNINNKIITNIARLITLNINPLLPFF